MTLLERLREQTSPWHARLEAELPLLATPADERAYRDYLAKLWGFHAPIERDLGCLSALETAGFRRAERAKCGALAADLAALGLGAAELTRLPWCSFAPRICDLPAALGCSYVLEGATLGGRVLWRELGRTLPAAMARAARYLTIYGPETGARWQVFVRVLAAFPAEPRSEAVLIDTACATFRALHRWLVEPPAVTGPHTRNGADLHG